MDHTRLGRTGLPVSRLCLGTMTFGLQCSEQHGRRHPRPRRRGRRRLSRHRRRLPVGRRPHHARRTEEILGRWLPGKRGTFSLATKCFAPTGPNPWDAGPLAQHIFHAVENSLRRLQTDWIDLYQLHGYDPQTPIDETLEALDRLVQDGKVRYIGCSNWLRTNSRAPSGAARRCSCPIRLRAAALQPAVSRVRARLVPVLPWRRASASSATTRSPVDCCGKHDAAGRRRRAPLHARLRGREYQQRYWHERQFESVDQLRGVAADAGVPLGRWPWRGCCEPGVTAPIVGASRPEQLDASLAAACRQGRR